MLVLLLLVLLLLVLLLLLLASLEYNRLEETRDCAAGAILKNELDDSDGDRADTDTAVQLRNE